MFSSGLSSGPETGSPSSLIRTHNVRPQSTFAHRLAVSSALAILPLSARISHILLSVSQAFFSSAKYWLISLTVLLDLIIGLVVNRKPLMTEINTIKHRSIHV